MELIMNNKKKLLQMVVLLIILSVQGLWADDDSSGVHIGFNLEQGRIYRGTIEIGTYGSSKQIMMIMDISTRSLPGEDGFIAQRIESLKVSYDDELFYNSENYKPNRENGEEEFLLNAMLNKDLIFQIDSMGNLLTAPDIKSLYPSSEEFETVLGSASDYDYYFEDFEEVYNDMVGDLFIGKYSFPDKLLFPEDCWYSAKKQSINYDNFWTESYYTLDSVEDGKLDISIDGRILEDDGNNIEMKMFANLCGSVVIDQDSGMPIEQILTTTQKVNNYWQTSTITTLISYRDRDSSEPFGMAKKLKMINSLSEFNRLLKKYRSQGGVITDKSTLYELNYKNIAMNDFLVQILGSAPLEFNKKLFSESLYLSSKGLKGDFWCVPERTFFKLDTVFQKADGSSLESLFQDEYLPPRMLQFIFGDSLEELFYYKKNPVSFGLPLSGRLEVLIESEGDSFPIDKKHINTPDGYVEILESGPGWAAILVKGANAWSADFTNCMASEAVCLAAYKGEPLEKWENSELVYIITAADKEFIPEIQLSFAFNKEIIDLEITGDFFSDKSYFPVDFDPGYKSLTIDQLDGAFQVSSIKDEYYSDDFTYSITVPSYSNSVLAKINYSETMLQLFMDGELDARFDPFLNEICFTSSQDLSGETIVIEYPLKVEVREYTRDSYPDGVEWTNDSISLRVDENEAADIKDLPLAAYWYDMEIFNSRWAPFYQHLIARPLNKGGQQLLASPSYIETSDSVFINLTHNDQMVKLQMDEGSDYSDFSVTFSETR